MCQYNLQVYFLMKGSIYYIPQEQEILDEVWTSVYSSSSVSQTRGRVRSRRSFVSYSPPSSTLSTLRISVPRRVTGTPPSPTNIWFRGGTNASPFSTRPLEPGVRSGTPRLSRCSLTAGRASRVVSTTTVKPSASSTNRLGSAT